MAGDPVGSRVRGRILSPVDDVRWPPALRVMTFGRRYNKPVARVRWSGSLKELDFGRNFNLPTEVVKLPAGLETLRMNKRLQLPYRRGNVGVHRYYALAEIVWPNGLQEIVFRCCFNKPIVGVMWSFGLQKLVFGYAFTGETYFTRLDIEQPNVCFNIRLLGK